MPLAGTTNMMQKTKEQLQKNKKRKFKSKSHVFIVDSQGKQGGNGKVLDVLKIDGNETDEYVLKLFIANDGKYTRNERRYKRFLREIKIIKKLQSKIPEIIPIFDCRYDSKYSSRAKAWYVMKKAKEFKIENDTKLSFLEKLNKILQLANVIKKIHELPENYSHRDIKPDNILIYDDEMTLCDFGLATYYAANNITIDGEQIGPKNLLPPELERGYNKNQKIKIDYQKSDVYMFAKVLWMYLKGQDSCFHGEYSRSEAHKYLDKTTFKEKIITLEPIHLLLEEAIQYDFQKRIDISQCIYYIQKQIDILNKNISEDEINQLLYFEVSKHFLYTTTPLEMCYSDKNQIYHILNELLYCGKFLIDDFGVKTKIEFDEMKIIQENDYLLIECSSGTIKVKIAFLPAKMTYILKEKTYVLVTDDSEKMNEIYLFKDDNNIISQSQYRLSKGVKIIIKYNNDLD